MTPKQYVKATSKIDSKKVKEEIHNLYLKYYGGRTNAKKRDSNYKK